MTVKYTIKASVQSPTDDMADTAAEQLAKLRIGVLTHFDEAYGKNVARIEGWQQLCCDLGVDAGTSITQCKKNLKGTYVNIVDFVQAKKNEVEVRTFSSASALSKYIKKHGKKKRFPLDQAKENLFLRWMLIHVR